MNRVIIDNDLDATIVKEDNMKVLINDRDEKVKYYSICNNFIYLSHIPLYYNNSYNINLHGHYHPGPKSKYDLIENMNICTYDYGGRHYNCAVDYNDFKPISLCEIFTKMNITLEDIIKAIPYEE